MGSETKKSSKKKAAPQPARSLAAALKKALAANKSVSGWTLRATETRSRELYMSRLEEEASRQIYGQRAEAVLYTKNGEQMGSATVALAPGEEKLARDRVEAAMFVASSTAMEPCPLPGPADLPEVTIVDERIRDNPTGALKELRAQLRAGIESAGDIALAAAEFFLDAFRLMMEVMGQRGYLTSASDEAVAKGIVETLFRSLLILTFGGGTNEIQRDLIGLFGLGLPRIPRM